MLWFNSYPLEIAQWSVLRDCSSLDPSLIVARLGDGWLIDWTIGYLEKSANRMILPLLQDSEIDRVVDQIQIQLVLRLLGGYLLQDGR